MAENTWFEAFSKHMNPVFSEQDFTNYKQKFILSNYNYKIISENIN